MLSVIQKEFYLDHFTSLLQKNTGLEIREHTFQPWQSQTNFRTLKKSFTHYFQKLKGEVRLCTFLLCESIPHFLSHKDMILNSLYLIHMVIDFIYLLVCLNLMNLDGQSPLNCLIPILVSYPSTKLIRVFSKHFWNWLGYRLVNKENNMLIIRDVNCTFTDDDFEHLRTRTDNAALEVPGWIWEQSLPLLLHLKHPSHPLILVS